MGAVTSWADSRTRGARASIAATAAAAFLAAFVPRPARAQDEIASKVLGTQGLSAGMVPEAGIALQAAFLGYTSDKLRDRYGHELPVGLSLAAQAGVFGASVTSKLPSISTYLTAAAGMPVARVLGVVQKPQASIDKEGLGDLFVRPIELGWKVSQVEIVAGYTFYIPTGAYEPGGSDGVGRGSIAHDPSLGGTVYFDRAKRWSLSVLASLELNGRKRSVDIRRGTTVQAQGGFGGKFFGVLEAGIAGYALAQITDDEGKDVPDVVRGARDRAFGLGPEIDVQIPPIRSRLTARYEHDLAVASRPEGQVFVLQLSVLAWQPAPSGR
jgi:hypothetical protein